MISETALAAQSFQRHIIIAADLSDQSWRALCYAANEVYRAGDLFHLVHVSRCLQPQLTIQHNYPGATYDIPLLKPFDEQAHTKEIKDVIKSRFAPLLDELRIPHMVHLFLDTDNAPASAVCAVLFKLARDVDAAMIVLAAHNKAYGWNEYLLGSVAEYCLQHSPSPTMIVRDYTVDLQGHRPGTLTIPAAAKEHQHLSEHGDSSGHTCVIRAAASHPHTD